MRREEGGWEDKKKEETHLRLLIPIHRVRAITALHPAHPAVDAVQLVLHMALLVAVRVHGRRLSHRVARGQGGGGGRIRVLCAPLVCRSDQLELEPGAWICCACCPALVHAYDKGVEEGNRYVGV
jgi:hypothetical protein